MSDIIDTAALVSIINKIENIEQDKQEASDCLKDAYSEAKSLGYDVKIIKHILKLKKKDTADLAEEDSLIELYRGALNI